MTFFNFIKRIRDLGEDEFYQSILYVAGKVGINASSNRYGIGLNNMSRSIKEEIDFYNKKNYRINIIYILIRKNLNQWN